ncbi:Metallo-dependent hydrolase [Guyanagaster necrorhizus]|uniref:Metallo-dependent hydrolase n=1 Tax=Guyanagaster necrorhizus TaxID=856835 RepID=A0A9P7W4Z9_9AGAR|nr:Metallo-dependent hydrolase [Guyanagaster necrorhizus MCA 3950]KAG7452247.1 Metallo-dependent hydrolase [Guyanagaster necrorhizus MCA 3950]
MSGVPLPDESVLQHVVDVHCHPTDAPSISPESMDKLQITICAMGSRTSDQVLVKKLAASYPKKVIPCFGYHPWFSHCITLQPGATKDEHYRRLFAVENFDEYQAIYNTLPQPVSIAEVISEVQANLEAFPNAMLGEVGLDRAFRIPYDYAAFPRELTSFTVPIDHQLAILEAQVDLAVKLRRNISLHSVKAQMNTTEFLNRMSQRHGRNWSKISIDLHSCGLSPQLWRDMEKKHNNVFLSLSTIINGRSSNHISLIQACSPNRILVESDFHDVDMCTQQTWDMLLTVARTNGWIVEEVWTSEVDPAKWGAVRRLEENWRQFRAGDHQAPELSKRKKKKVEEWISESNTDS